MTLAEEKETDNGVSSPPSLHNDKQDLEKGANTDIETETNTLKEDDPGVAAANGEEEYPTGVRMIFIVVALVLSIFLVSLDMTIVATAIPKITDQFHGLSLVGWYGSAFFLTLAAFQSTWGKIYKYFPLKTGFLVAIFIFELGSLICGVAPNSTALIVGRAIAGLGGAGIASGAYTIIAFSARPAMRPAFTGILGASYGIASVIGPLLGGVFAEKATWRWCFYINLPIGGIAGAIILLMFQTPSAAVPVKAPFREKILQMDPIGTGIIIPAVVCFILALQWGGQSASWHSGKVVATLVVFGVLMVVFCINEYFQGEHAIVVPRLMKNRVVAVGMIYVFFLAGGFFLLLYYMPIYFQVVDGVSASQSGVRNLAMILATTIATIASGILITAFGHFVPLMILGAVLLTIGSGLIYTLGLHASAGKWIGYQIIAGFGVGLSLQIPVITAQATVDPSDLSSATAMVLFMQTLGGAFMVSAGESAFTNRLLQKLPTLAPSVSPALVSSIGITEIRKTFAPDVVPGIVASYLDGLKVAYAISIALGGIAVLVSLASKWKNIKGAEAMGGGA
ncbi:major facilitator superfamily domain-containing protein [Xylogone sp. PMI_703]|nr:major facilitator superfamily domain-containing protein [Xylogone sp. PMI_703]